MLTRTIEIRHDNVYEQREKLDNPEFLNLLGVALIGGVTPDGERGVEFTDEKEEDRNLVLSYATRAWLEQWMSNDPRHYLQSMSLATRAPYSVVRGRALTLMGQNLSDWCISTASGQSERLWSKDLSQGEKERHVGNISSQLINLAKSDQDVSLRGQAAMLLSRFAQNVYYPYIGIENLGQFNFLETFISLVGDEQDPQAKADKLLAYLEFVTEPDVYRRFATGEDDQLGYCSLMLGWKETVNDFVDDPKNAIEALRLITTIYLSPLQNLWHLKQERVGPLNLKKIRDIALNSGAQIKEQAIKMAEDLLVMLMGSREIRGLSSEDREKIRREIASLLLGNK